MERDAFDRIGLRAIFFVADDGATRFGELHANLVAAARLQRQLDQRGRLAFFRHAITGDGVARFGPFLPA